MNRNSLFSLTFTALFLYLFFFDFSPLQLLAGDKGLSEALFTSRLEWAAIFEQILGMNLFWFTIAATTLLLAMVVRTFRWQLILSPLDRLSFGTVFGLNNLGYMANNLLPMRLGEVLRSVVLARKSRLDVPSAFATVVIERIFDMLGALGCVFLLFLVIPVEILGEHADTLKGILPILALGTGLGMLGLVSLVFFRNHLLRFSDKLRVVLPAKTADMVTKLLASFTQGMATLESPKRVLVLLLQTVALYACYFISLKCMLLAMDLGGESLPLLAKYPLGSTLMILVFVTMGYMIPAAPGAIGTVQYFTALGLELLGVAPSPAGGFALVNHFLTYAILTGLGVIALYTLKIRFRELIRIQHGEDIELRGKPQA